MVRRGFYLEPGSGLIEHAVDTSKLTPKNVNGIRSWVDYFLTNSPIKQI